MVENILKVEDLSPVLTDFEQTLQDHVMTVKDPYARKHARLMEQVARLSTVTQEGMSAWMRTDACATTLVAMLELSESIGILGDDDVSMANILVAAHKKMSFAAHQPKVLSTKEKL